MAVETIAKIVKYAMFALIIITIVSMKYQNEREKRDLCAQFNGFYDGDECIRK